MGIATGRQIRGTTVVKQSKNKLSPASEQQRQLLQGKTQSVTQMKQQLRQMRKHTDAWEAQLKQFEKELQSTGDDAQLANVDLQGLLQKQQQTLQMLSNISKFTHDTAMAVIRKIGG